MSNLNKSKGQYFTTNKDLQKTVYSFIKNIPKSKSISKTPILEPSFGRGDLVKYTQTQNPKLTFDLFEIDKKIKPLPNIKANHVEYCDFMAKKFSPQIKYQTIIGNPPYVKTKKGNLYIDFIDKCTDLLHPGGELIFVIPSDFFKLTMAKKTINKMFEQGTFTHIYHPHNEGLFKDASIDVLVFRYQKTQTKSTKSTNPTTNKVLYNGKSLFANNSDGVVTFTRTNTQNQSKIEDYFDVHVGMITGKEDIYKHPTFGNISVLNKKDQKDKYIFINKYPSGNKKIDTYLKKHKSALLGRRIRKFNEKNWYEWGAPRNIQIMEQYKGKDCIYISNITRQKEVAFKGKVGYFGGSLIMLRPKETNNTKKINLDKVVTYLNSSEFQENFIYSGRFKIGHRQLCKTPLPFKSLQLFYFEHIPLHFLAK